jgi:hypothetical protein
MRERVGHPPQCNTKVAGCRCQNLATRPFFRTGPNATRFLFFGSPEHRGYSVQQRSHHLLDEDAWFNLEMEVAAFRFRHLASHHFSEDAFDWSFDRGARARTAESHTLSPCSLKDIRYRRTHVHTSGDLFSTKVRCEALVECFPAQCFQFLKCSRQPYNGSVPLHRVIGADFKNVILGVHRPIPLAGFCRG